MPSSQSGSAVKRGRGWAARWYDENGVRRFQGGFETKSPAREWDNGKVDEVAALRRGDPSTTRRQQMPMLGELLAEFVGQHAAEASTIASPEKRLRYALDGPKLDGKGGWRDVRLDRLQPHETGAWRKHLPTRSAHGIQGPPAGCRCSRV